MSTKFFILLGFAIFAVGCGHVVKRDAPTASQGEVVFNDLIESFKKGMANLQDIALKVAGVENTEQLQEKLAAQGKEAVERLDGLATSIKQETEGLKDHAIVKDVREMADNLVKDFNERHPETSADLKKFIDTTNTNVKNMVTKLEEMGQSENANNIKELSKRLLSETTSAVKTIGDKVMDGLKQ